MKRYEMLQDERKRHDVARDICDLISEKVEDCESCPFTDRCGRGHNGVLDYFMEDVQE